MSIWAFELIGELAASPIVEKLLKRVVLVTSGRDCDRPSKTSGERLTTSNPRRPRRRFNITASGRIGRKSVPDNNPAGVIADCDHLQNSIRYRLLRGRIHHEDCHFDARKRRWTPCNATAKRTGPDHQQHHFSDGLHGFAERYRSGTPLAGAGGA